MKFHQGFDFQKMQGCFISLEISVTLNENLVGLNDMQPITMLSKTRASASSRVPNAKKQMKGRRGVVCKV